tara:strand:+ start:1452 stop:1973 length:522 start_codon:yes stop_codon:yes gene_type:complete
MVSGGEVCEALLRHRRNQIQEGPNMDISSNLAVAPPPPAAPAADRAPARDAVQPVKTEAARVQSVPAETATDKAGERRASNAERAAGDAAEAEKTSPEPDYAAKQVDRQFEIEPKTETLVYKAVDPEDGDVVRQVPEDVILKLRATYNSEPLAQDAGSDSKPGEIHRLIDRIA